jgi:cytochrome c oxidase subunit II
MRVRALWIWSGILLAGGLQFPVAAVAVPTAYQEYLDAIKARPDVNRGAQYFVACAGCHGPQGGGKADGQVPRIGGQYFRVIARQLVAFRHGQRWDIRMENFADRHRLLDAQAIADVAEYVSELSDSSPSGVGSGEFVTQGARVYFRLCETCHGTSGQGDPNNLVPRIGGQHYEYLRRQIYDAVDGRRPGFPAPHVRLLARLEHDDIAGVADYLSRIAPNPSEPPALPAAPH